MFRPLSFILGYIIALIFNITWLLLEGSIHWYKDIDGNLNQLLFLHKMTGKLSLPTRI